MVFTSFEWQQQVEPAAPHTHFGVVLFHESERFPRSPASKEKRSRWVEASEKQAAAVCRRAHYVRKKPSLIHTHTRIKRGCTGPFLLLLGQKHTCSAHLRFLSDWMREEGSLGFRTGMRARLVWFLLGLLWAEHFWKYAACEKRMDVMRERDAKNLYLTSVGVCAAARKERMQVGCTFGDDARLLPDENVWKE